MLKGTVLITAAAASAFLLGTVAPAAAQSDSEPDLTVDIDYTVERPPPNPKEVAREDVPEDLVGRSCVVTLIAANNDSVHEGNNLTVRSGDDAATFDNVESEAFQTTTAEGQLVLGDEIVVELTFGQDNVSSGGLKLTFDCVEETTTTTEATTTSTTVPVDVESSTTIVTTTAPVDVLDSSVNRSTQSAAALSLTG